MSPYEVVEMVYKIALVACLVSCSLLGISLSILYTWKRR